MDELRDFISTTEEMLSGYGARISAIESVLASMQGVSMQSDPTRLPTVVFEQTTPPTNVGEPNADN